MNRLATLAASLALAAGATAAAAQSNVRVSGMLDTGLQHVKTFDGRTSKNVSGGGFQSSRLRFTGKEDLGGGLHADFWLESQVYVNNGTSSSMGMWNRASWVGLADDDWGALRLGRMNTPSGTVVCVIDLHWCGSGFNSSGIFYNGTNQVGRWIVPNAGRGGNGNQGVSVFSGGTGVARSADSARINHAVFYETQRIGGFQAQLMYGLGHAGDNPANGSGDHLGLSLAYRSGAWYLAVAYEHVEPDPLWNAKGQVLSLGGTYKTGDLRIGAIVQQESASGPAAVWTRARAWALTTAYRMGAYEPYLKVGTHRTNGTGSYGIVDGMDAQMFNLGTLYDLSKRTRFYADFAIDFAGSKGAGVDRNDPRQLQVGVQHVF